MPCCDARCTKQRLTVHSCSTLYCLLLLLLVGMLSGVSAYLLFTAAASSICLATLRTSLWMKVPVTSCRLSAALLTVLLLLLLLLLEEVAVLG